VSEDVEADPPAAANATEPPERSETAAEAEPAEVEPAEAAVKKPAPNQPQLPWEGRPERADILCWLGIVVSGLYRLAMIPLKPVLIVHPLLMELADGSMTAMVTAGAYARIGKLPLLVALIAAIPGSMIFDPLYWWAGHRWGRRVIEIFAGRGARSRRNVDRAERWFHRFGWPAVILAYFLPVPSAIIYAFAGWSRMRLLTFLILDLIGTLLWIGLFVALGYSIGKSAVDVAQEISHYALWITIGLIVVIVAPQMWRMRRQAAP
jgi:membrane protein DedA with SNARE-associated domain